MAARDFELSHDYTGGASSGAPFLFGEPMRQYQKWKSGRWVSLDLQGLLARLRDPQIARLDFYAERAHQREQAQDDVALRAAADQIAARIAARTEPRGWHEYLRLERAIQWDASPVSDVAGDWFANKQGEVFCSRMSREIKGRWWIGEKRCGGYFSECRRLTPDEAAKAHSQ